MIDLSVIVTFYNGSKYLKSCIQTLKHIQDESIEILFIDDGSDKVEYEALQKAVSFLKKQNVRVIRREFNEHIGAGVAKNEAIANAKGRYVIFLDCDDYVSANYYHRILDIIKKTKADIVCTDIIVKFPDKEILETIFDFNLIQEIPLKTDQTYYTLDSRYVLGNKFSASACNKAIKKELLQKFQFNHNTCDDLTAIIPTICVSEKIVYVSGIYYYYCQTSSSLTRHNSLQNYFDSLNSLFATYDILKNNKVDDENILLFYANNVVPFIFFNIISNSEKNRLKLCKYLHKRTTANNFSSHLVTANPFVQQLSYMNEYNTQLFCYMEKRQYYLLNFVVIFHKVWYKLFRWEKK